MTVRRHALRLVLAVCWLPTAALALDPGKPLRQAILEVWQTDQGLPQNSVHAIRQTRDGYLWLATQEGLVRFDGVRFTVYDKRSAPALRSNTIRALLEAKDGGLWVGTFGGGVSLVRGGLVVPYAGEERLADDRVNSLHEDRAGNLWIATNGGLKRRAPDGTLTHFTTKDGLPSDRISPLREDRDGNLWIGTFGGGLCRMRDGRFSTLTVKDGLPKDLVVSLLEDRQGSLWIGTFGGGLSRLRDGTFTTFAAKEGLPNEQVLSLYQDRAGDLWVGTNGGGLSRFREGRFEPFTTKDGLSNDRVLAVEEDHEGSLWIGTFGGGLNRLRDGKLAAFSVRDGLSHDNANAIYQDRAGDLWIGTFGGGLCRLRNGSVETIYTAKEGLAGDQVNTILEDRDGSLWVGTSGTGLSRLRNGRWTTFTTKDGLPNDNVLTLHEDRAGRLWIGTFGGLCRRDGEQLTKLSGDQVNVLHEDARGAVWIGTRGSGLCRLQDGARSCYTTKQGLSSDMVYAIHEDGDGTLWIGTGGGGLTRLKNGKLSAITSKSGLYDDTVFQVLEDDRGDLFMSCNKGIFRAARKELNAFADGTAKTVGCVAYGTADGMRSAECNGGSQPAGWKTRDGRLWFPTIKGAVVIDPARIPRNERPPAVLVEEVRIDGEALPLAAGEKEVVLSPGKEKFDFHYTALSFRVPRRVRFKYRLEGFDREWVDAGAERTARYTNLRPRRYTFRVAACNDDGVWNESGAAFAFTLEPYVTQTWSFYLLCGVAVAGLAFGAHRTRVARLQAREKELTRAVDERTNELRAANVELQSAQERISHLLESSPASVDNLPEWSRAMADELAAAIGAKAIGIWEVDRDSIAPLSDAGLMPPSREELQRAVSTGSGDGTTIPVTGMTGELCGTLVIYGMELWGDTERRLVAGFARLLGGALEMNRLRRQLASAQQRHAQARREMHARGIATLQICPKCGRCYDHTATACEKDGEPLDDPRPLPYVLLGRYRFVQVLGEGGMGLVLSARDEKLGRDVAVKLIRAERWSHLEVRQRFEREARAVARIQHPGVVELHDSGELEDGTAFLVMEKLAGSDLSNVLKDRGPGTPREVARLVRQGCAALAAAHRAGVIHRDIKPENVFLVDDPTGFRVKLVDFGLAKSMTFEEGLTQSGMMVGTPAYMAPEQVQDGQVDERSDIYSFAAVAYEALTGRKAIPGRDLGRVLINVVSAMPEDVSSLVAGLPAEVDRAFSAALAKSRAKRPEDIEAWGAPLARALEEAPANPDVRGWKR